MIDDLLITRLAAANPVPSTAPLRAPVERSARSRIRLAAVIAVAAIAVPAAAFADDIGGLLGISNQGTPVAVSDTPFSSVAGLAQGMSQIGFPSTLQLLAQRDGFSFYAARNADGKFCFAFESSFGKGFGCDFNSPDQAFPSAARPILDFSSFTEGAHVVGLAADGIANVALIDASGATLVTVPVEGNIYALASAPAGGAAVEALDAAGNVVYTRRFGEGP